MADDRKFERIRFSGKEDDFAYFQEQFEARMFTLKLLDALLGRVDVTHFERRLSPNANARTVQQNRDEAELQFMNVKQQIWCELVQALDKKSVLFLRPHKNDGPKAWSVLCKRFKSLERPRIHQLIEKLTNLRKDPKESLLDYLNRAEELQYDLTLAKENLSESMFLSIVLKGLPKEFETFVTFVKFSREEKSFEEVKTDEKVETKNFDLEKKKADKPEQTFLSDNTGKCFKCDIPGHKV